MKKFFGILLIVLGGFLSLSVLLFLIEFLLRLMNNTKLDTYNFGFNVGQFVINGIFGFVSFWLIKKGNQLIRNK